MLTTKLSGLLGFSCVCYVLATSLNPTFSNSTNKTIVEQLEQSCPVVNLIFVRNKFSKVYFS